MTKNNKKEMELIAQNWEAYQLLDSGKGRKLEQFGDFRVIRDEPRAIWKPVRPNREWEKADAEYQIDPKNKQGRWQLKNPAAKKFTIDYRGLKLQIELDQSKQVGIFPENASHWDFIESVCAQQNHPINVLNLFGYTGVSALAAARGGANVTHVDSSKRAVRLGRENQTLSGLEDRSIRWIVDDVLKYLQREARREIKYDAIIMDPPKYGLGANKERWTFDSMYPDLIEACAQVLSDQPVFVVLTAYTINMTAEELVPSIEKLVAPHMGKFEYGQLVAKEKSAGRKIEYSEYVRWQKK